MRIRTHTAWLLTILAIGLMGCAPYAGWQSYANEEVGISIRIPSDWDIYECPADWCAYPTVEFIPPDHGMEGRFRVSHEYRPFDTVRSLYLSSAAPLFTETRRTIASYEAFVYTTESSNFTEIYIPLSDMFYFIVASQYPSREVQLVIDSIAISP